MPPLHPVCAGRACRSARARPSPWVTSPACSKTPTCFFMPVRVMWNLSARSVIEASARPGCSRTPRRVASESAANTPTECPHHHGQLQPPQNGADPELVAKRPRFHVHFTPTYGSWLSLVERWFAELTMKRIRRGTFRSVPQLKAAIQEFIDAHQTDPKPFVRTKSADEILASIARFAQRTVDARAALQLSRTTITGHWYLLCQIRGFTPGSDGN